MGLYGYTHVSFDVSFDSLPHASRRVTSRGEIVSVCPLRESRSVLQVSFDRESFSFEGESVSFAGLF